MAVLAIFRIRRDTSANWTAVNPVLELGEPGLETNTRRVKYGDGATAWNALPYSTAVVAFADVTGKPTTLAGYGITDAQPLDSDLTAIAALSTTSFGRALLALADAAALRTAAGLGTMATQNANGVAITGGALAGITAATFGLGANNFQITTTGQHLRLMNGAELGNIQLQSTGQLDIWAHGDNATDIVRVLTGSGSGTIRGTFSTTGLAVVGSVKSSSYTVATVPSASTHGAGAQIYVSNESGGAVMAFSDGTNWRRVTDRAIVS